MPLHFPDIHETIDPYIPCRQRQPYLRVMIHILIPADWMNLSTITNRKIIMGTIKGEVTDEQIEITNNQNPVSVPFQLTHTKQNLLRDPRVSSR